MGPCIVVNRSGVEGKKIVAMLGAQDLSLSTVRIPLMVQIQVQPKAKHRLEYINPKLSFNSGWTIGLVALGRLWKWKSNACDSYALKHWLVLALLFLVGKLK